MRKKTCEISGTVLTVDVFAANVLVIVCGDLKVLKDNLKDVYKKVDADEEYENDKVELAKALDSKASYGGMTITIEGVHKFDSIVVFVAKNLSEVSYEVMVHELYHVVQSICYSRGIDDDETEAYLMEYLFGSLLDAVDEYNDDGQN